MSQQDPSVVGSETMDTPSVVGEDIVSPFPPINHNITPGRYRSISDGSQVVVTGVRYLPKSTIPSVVFRADDNGLYLSPLHVFVRSYGRVTGISKGSLRANGVDVDGTAGGAKPLSVHIGEPKSR